MSAPGPIGALTVGATDDGLALVVFGDHPEAAAQAAERLGLAAVAGAGRGGGAASRSTWRGSGRCSTCRWTGRSPTARSAGCCRRCYATVGFGDTVTYGELAARGKLGSAYTAARGVGAIMGSNPLPVVVPCHRVMAADGLGGFGGGRATKEWLLALEGVLTAALDFGD